MDSTPTKGFGAGSVSRRQFLKASVGAAAIGALAGQFAPRAFAQGTETLRVGLVGCGGRGTGAAMQTLAADPNVQLVAMGDAFANRLQSSLEGLKGSDAADRVLVDAEHQFVGLECGKQVIDCVDVVLLCEPPQFRPMNLKAAIAAGKHVFCEKPVAVDVPGVHAVMAAAREAQQKNLTLVSGLCWRYEQGMREAVQRVLDGGIGEVVAMQSTRHEVGVGKFAQAEPGWGPLETQVRNWYFWTWLSGDFVVEQFVHDLDMMAWAIGKYPTRCTCTGGRQVRTGPETGNIYDHFAAVFEFDNGVKLFADTRQWPACDRYYTNSVFGTKGVVDLLGASNTDRNTFRREGKSDMYQSEHDALYAAIRGGQPINNGDYMANSTLMGLMARQSAYTGKDITWEQISNSQEDLSPIALDMNAPIPEPPIAVPGQTQFS